MCDNDKLAETECIEMRTRDASFAWKVWHFMTFDHVYQMDVHRNDGDF